MLICESKERQTQFNLLYVSNLDFDKGENSGLQEFMRRMIEISPRLVKVLSAKTENRYPSRQKFSKTRLKAEKGRFHAFLKIFVCLGMRLQH
jgi:hypothetical protein